MCGRYICNNKQYINQHDLISHKQNNQTLYQLQIHYSQQEFYCPNKNIYQMSKIGFTKQITETPNIETQKVFIYNNHAKPDTQFQLINIVDKLRKKNTHLKRMLYDDALLISSQTGSKMQHQTIRTMDIKKQCRDISKQIKTIEQTQKIKFPKIGTEQKDTNKFIFPINIFNKKQVQERLKINPYPKSKAMRKLVETFLQYENFVKNNMKQSLELEGSRIQHSENITKKKSEYKKKLYNLDEQRKKSLIIYRQKKKIKIKKRQAQKKIYFQYAIFLRFILNLNQVDSCVHPFRRYKFFVAEGNNSFLVKSIIRHRFWWKIVENKNEANLMWTQNKSKQFTEKLGCLEPNKQIDEEYQQIENTVYEQKMEAQELLIQKEFPQLSLIDIKSDNKFNKQMKSQNENKTEMYSKFVSKQECQKIEKMSLQNYMNVMKNQNFTIIKQKNYNIHNHLECHWHLSNKKALFINMKKYYEDLKKDPFEYIPRTYHIKLFKDPQYIAFQQYFKLSKNLWILKPGQNTNRGTGINVAQSWSDIQKLIVAGCTNNRTMIAQEYITPFLYNNRKFDIRCYLLITSLNNTIKGYWYEQGYIRTASKQFNINNITNKMIHLTNDAIQKNGQDYGKYEPYNKISFKQMDRYFNERKKNFSNVKNQMRQLALDCLKASYKKLDPKKRKFTFEIFGLDFLVDQKGKTWLIQANTNPCLQLSGNLLARIIPHMLENTFRIALDPIFSPPQYQNWSVNRRIQYSNKIFSSNKYQLIFEQEKICNQNY